MRSSCSPPASNSPFALGPKPCDDFGFTYSIFFDGNAFRPRIQIDSDAPSSVNDTLVRPGLFFFLVFGGCSPFATTIAGVPTSGSNEAAAGAERGAARGAASAK